MQAVRHNTAAGTLRVWAKETDWVVEWLEREESYMCKYHETAVGRIVNDGEVSVGLREQTARVAQETYVNLGAAFRGTKCQSDLSFLYHCPPPCSYFHLLRI